MASLRDEPFGNLADGTAIRRFTLKGNNGMLVRLLEIGAIVSELHVPDVNGDFTDVVLGFDTLAEYEANPAYFGCATGRVANRIDEGRFELDGTTYELVVNDPPNHLHGGEGGFHRAYWKAEPVDSPQPTVHFHYVSADGEDGYPGELSTDIDYTLTDEGGLRIEYTATTDTSTILNLTNHSYFNLSGHDAGTILDHELNLNASKFTEPDANGLPTGRILPVAGTSLDFTNTHCIGERIDQLAGGYDHNYVLNGYDGESVRSIAIVNDPRSGRRMETLTSQPGVQLYTSNFLSDLHGKGGARYDKHGALCLETQHFPNAINQPDFPSIILHPGERYRHTTEYQFSAT
ncbi:MAG: aldose epimerase family protein [Candidatus Latescibacterota bacterium]|nr:aldose epimerase family protein [Candidatus Latescibacterota bacterium]